MEVVGKVTQAEVPQGRKKAFGVWTALARQIIDAHMQGEVLVVKVANADERRRMANGVSEVLRLAGFSRSFTTVEDGEGLRVYCQMTDKQLRNGVHRRWSLHQASQAHEGRRLSVCPGTSWSWRLSRCCSRCPMWPC